ncbi:Zinc-finger homeodomain protein 8 [Hirschfeldia incana]|nr:Zinc-finger homeodomain protein 8 [Hirschfeldia incana]
MDVIATSATIVSDLDSRQAIIEAPTRIQPAKPISFSNGKRCLDHHQHHASPQVVVTYKECLKNHAAGIGGHALDGCGEFIPSPSFNSCDPTSLTCDACGCHRNFHRREDDLSSLSAVVPRIEYRPHNRHQLPPPPIPSVGAGSQDDDDPASPPPISSSYMLLALSGGATGAPVSRKRFRTKFSEFQKRKMFEFAERVGWRMPKADDVDVVMEFCREIGVEKNVFKVWMHNNKTPGRGGARRANGEGRESVPTNGNGSFSST